jgi:hypothetical protein
VQDDLQQCESDVERARARLAHDLGTLRSRETVSSFTQSLKQEAMNAKDAVIEQASETIQSKLSEFVEDLKAKAAANPAAALSIGAGLAWQFIRNPPIATALVGAGLISLLRTQAKSQASYGTPDYLQQGKARLKEQVEELGTSAMVVAGTVQEAASRKAGETFEAAKDTAREWARSASDTVSAAGNTLSQHAADAMEATKAGAADLKRTAREAVATSAEAVSERTDAVRSSIRRARHDFVDTASQATAQGTAATKEMIGNAAGLGRDMLSTGEPRDKLLLGLAGLAVAAALGIAYQKRASEDVK